MGERAKVTVYVVTHECNGADAAGRTCRVRADHGKFFEYEHAFAHGAKLETTPGFEGVKIEEREEYADEQHLEHQKVFVRLLAAATLTPGLARA
jgi:hypothetical protein